MANFSSFFPEIGSGGGGGLTNNPLDLPRFYPRHDYLYLKYASNSIYAVSSQSFWDEYANIWTYGVLASNDTYLTIADVSGNNGGVLHHVIGPGSYVQTNWQYIRITVDGTEYEISMRTDDNYYSGARMYLGGVISGFPGGTAATGEHLFNDSNSYYNNANETPPNGGFISNAGLNYLTLPTAHQANFLPTLRFESSLKVEVKQQYLRSIHLGTTVGCAYKLF
mgnify:CR=1 FL=1